MTKTQLKNLIPEELYCDSPFKVNTSEERIWIFYQQFPKSKSKNVTDKGDLVAIGYINIETNIGNICTMHNSETLKQFVLLMLGKKYKNIHWSFN